MTPVGLAPYVVANGRLDGRTVKATLIIAPAPPGAGNAFALEAWPRQVVDRLFPRQGKGGRKPAFTILITDISGRTPDSESTPQIVPAKGGLLSVKDADWDAVADLWSRSLVPDRAVSTWTGLAAGIERSLNDHPEVSPSKYDPTSRADFDIDGAIIAPGGGPTGAEAAGQETIAGVVPVKQGDFGIEEERERALRVQRKMQCGPLSIDDEKNTSPKEDEEPKKFPTKAAYHDEIKEKLFSSYKQSVIDTSRDRDNSNDHFDKIRELLTGDRTSCPELTFLTRDTSPLPASASRTDEDRQAQRASHTYGSWLQRSNRYQLTNAKDDYEKSAEPTDVEQAAIIASDDTKRAMGLFYSLQGDYFLSRLFCLTIDITIALPEGLIGGGESEAEYLHLSFVKEGSTPGVASAAKLTGTGFWPVSVFEAGLGFADGKPCAVKELIEQSNGIWHLGAGYAPDEAGHGPRYELSSLDIRRAVDSKATATDRGERHISAGLTLLDRDRAAQIARELALAKYQQVANITVLHAEDLTIGRRADVSVVTAGTPCGTALDWRSLASRRVRFDFPDHPAADRVLRALLADRRRDNAYYDESYFQTTVRHMPRLGEGNAIDLVADEAIFLWDGTPAAVLTSAGGGSNAVQLPLIRRTYSLPAIGEYGEDICPPPLRYGVPYCLSLRSVFAGGGSPDLAAVAAYHQAEDGKAMVPPAAGKTLAPSAFLRHEGILAPTLLLPGHLAKDRYGVMGFEQVDQAIIRSGLDIPKPNPAAQAPDGSPYFSLASRLLPASTMRVFVAPEATVDEVIRHRRLDVSHSEDVLHGGLRDIGFLRRSPSVLPDQAAGVADGFPMVITRKLPALDGEGAAYARQDVADMQDKGIPVLVPGGAHAIEKGALGWMPDPAVWQFSVRARIRGSGCYLEGDLIAPLYEKDRLRNYPHALPLVVELVQKRGQRPRPAASIRELCATESAPLRWLTPGGTIRPANSAGAARVSALFS